MRWTRISALGLTASLALLATACGSSPTPQANQSGGQSGSSTTAAPSTTVGPAAQIAPVSMPTAAGHLRHRPAAHHRSHRRPPHRARVVRPHHRHRGQRRRRATP